MRIVFMGTPAFAATVLQRLCAWPEGEIVGVYCQPDRPAGRGHKLVPPPVKTLALEKGLSVFQPLHFREASACEQLEALRPDILAVAAYGLILPQRVLDAPRIAPLNVHGSLLPLYRGAAPIQRAIMDGREETGVSIMRMEAGLDTGPVYAMSPVPVGEHTAGSLHEALAEAGAELLVRVLERMRSGESLTPQAQDAAVATYAAKMSKADGYIRWDAPAAVVHAQIRAVTPWPAARATILSPQKGIFGVQLAPGSIGSEKPLSAPSGALWRCEDGSLAVVTADRLYMLRTVRPESRKDMSAQAFAHGYLGAENGVCGHCLAPGQESLG